MAAPEIGMGAVYTRTAQGEPLRDDDLTNRAALMDRYFHPYATAAAFAGLGETVVNQPFAGPYFPLAFSSSQDARVSSAMVELRRDTYLDRTVGVQSVARMLAQLVNTASGSPDH